MFIEFVARASSSNPWLDACHPIPYLPDMVLYSSILAADSRNPRKIPQIVKDLRA